MKTLLALVSLFLLASFLAVNPANALVGVCVDNMPGAPPCDDSVSTGPSTWVPSAPIKTPRDFARDAYNLALSYYRAGDFDQALTTAQQAIAYDASYSYPFNLLGNIYAERSDFRRALRLFEKALARENHEAFRANLQLMLQNWAWFALRANDLRTAEAAARSILAQNRGHRDALYILGRIREKQGDLDQAIFYYDRSRVDEANRLRERIAREQREEQERRYR